MMKSRTLSVQINRRPAAVYEFASNPRNLPQWVRSFCLSVRKSGDDWLMETTMFMLPDMSDAQFARDAGMVEADLATLKTVLEASG
jgi:hypothetical protein